MKRIVTLAAVLAVIGSLGLGGATSAAPQVEPAKFPYGVGANDVRPARANLWTNTTLPRVLIQWSTDSGFATLTGSANVAVSAGRDGNVFYRLLHLSPATTYFYRFADPANTSDTSRTGQLKTAPKATSDVDVTFTWSGDQDGEVNPETGQPCFNNMESFDPIAAENSDFYVNLGDTIYSDSRCRTSPASTLQEYEDAYKTNFSYDAFRNARSSVGYITQWDDHEVRNDFDSQTVDPTLLHNGRKAFIEMDGMAQPDPNLGFYRTFKYGKEAQVFVLDERSFRTNEADRIDFDNNGTEDCQNPTTGQPDVAPTLKQSVRDAFGSQLPSSGLSDPVSPQCLSNINAQSIDGVERTMLGDAQRAQFLSDLSKSTATFKLVFTEDQMQQFYAFPYDRWEGFGWERDTVLHYIDDHNIRNVVWLATDEHADMAKVVNFNTDTPGTAGQVENSWEYAVGPIATDVFAVEANNATGNDQTSGKLRGFLIGFNKNTCAQLGRPNDPHIYGYGWVHIDAATHTLTVEPKDSTGALIAGNGVPHRGVDIGCNNLVLTAS
jgi:phosphodiesterase/alkaline phosphatase D-like protein